MDDKSRRAVRAAAVAATASIALMVPVGTATADTGTAAPSAVNGAAFAPGELSTVMPMDNAPYW